MNLKIFEDVKLVSNNSKDSEVFFVGLDDDQLVKKNLLESMREILVTLQRYESFKKVRSQKVKEISELKKIMKEINELIVKLKTSLPKANISASVKKEVKQIDREIGKLTKKTKSSTTTKKTIAKAKPKAEMSELEKLENDLASIESRLKGL